LSSISRAITTAKKLREISDKIKNADLRNLVADLTLELAEMKTQLADVTEENRKLKARNADLESSEGEQCPKCQKRGWKLENSFPDPTFGTVGGIRRVYKCYLCGFTESPLITP
jgi:DNA repair exonuclease SbcCD ATPase subunit